MRCTILFLLLVLSGCIANNQTSNKCQINDYSELQSLLLVSSGGEGLSGLINVLPSLEYSLISQIKHNNENLTYCWYARGVDIVGLAAIKDSSVKTGYEYELVDGYWKLKNEYEVIAIISN